MRTSRGLRCDGCERIEDKFVLTADKRPPVDSRDRFFDFCIPPSVDPVTGKPNGKFRGLGMASDPRMPIPLHACPSCAAKLPKALKFSIRKMIVIPDAKTRIETEGMQLDGVRDLSALPNGPLRQALEPVVASGRLKKIK